MKCVAFLARYLVGLVLFAGLGCGPSQADAPCTELRGTTALYDPSLPERDTDAATWLGFPFPSDHRRTQRGTIALGDVPDPAGALPDYVSIAERELYGFGLNSGVHLAFDGPLDPTSLPEAPGAFEDAGAVVQLVDVTADSPEYGRRRPLRWEYRPQGGKYMPPHTLSVAPAWGFGLRQNTTYALLVTRELRAADGNPIGQPPVLAELLSASPKAQCAPAAVRETPELLDALHTRFAPLRAWLQEAALEAQEVAVATVFTTQQLTDALAQIRQQIYRELEAPSLDDSGWTPLGSGGQLHTERQDTWREGETVTYYEMEGHYQAPNYQRGEIPYINDGGGLNFVDDSPEPFFNETIRFRLTFPSTAPQGSSGCHPIVIYAHGTGGSAAGFASHTGGRLAGRGMAAIGIDQPMHGPRGNGKAVDEELHSFNFFNPESSRANFRQAAIDIFSLTRFIRQSLHVPAEASPSGDAICFDADRIAFFGHSHGGLSGAIAAAYETNIRAWMLSGAAGGLSITIMERKDILDFEEAFRLLFWLAEDEPLSALHPAMTIVQTLVDATDPINYAPFWVNRQAHSPPTHVLVTSGELDAASPRRGAAALAVRGRIPLVAPQALPIEGYALLDWAAEPPPVRGNMDGHTAGFLQWADDGKDASHFVIFRRPEAIHASMHFLRTALQQPGPPVIERVVDANVR